MPDRPVGGRECPPAVPDQPDRHVGRLFQMFNDGPDILAMLFGHAVSSTKILHAGRRLEYGDHETPINEILAVMDQETFFLTTYFAIVGQF